MDTYSALSTLRPKSSAGESPVGCPSPTIGTATARPTSARSDPATSTWFVDLNGDLAFDPNTEIRGWGSPGDTPVVGDWDGEGVDEIGAVSTDSTWFRDLNGDFAFDPATEILGWGSPGDKPVVADWNGDGVDDVGVFSGGTWFIDSNGNGAFDPGSDIYGWGLAGVVAGSWAVEVSQGQRHCVLPVDDCSRRIENHPG